MVGEIVIGDVDYGDEEEQLRLVTAPFESSLGTNIRVAVRCRPPNKREKALQEKQKSATDATDQSRKPALVVTIPGETPEVGRVEVWRSNSPFQYDIAFPMHSNQLDVFEHIGVDVVKCAFHGCKFHHHPSSSRERSYDPICF